MGMMEVEGMVVCDGYDGSICGWRWVAMILPVDWLSFLWLVIDCMVADFEISLS